jgi:hypothetical protein
VAYKLLLIALQICVTTANEAEDKSLLIKPDLQNNKNDQQVVLTAATSESEKNILSEGLLTNSQRFSDKYKNILGDSSTNLDLINDSAEILDNNDEKKDELSFGDSIKNGLKFDDFVAPKELETIKKSSYGELTGSANVFKVPKSKTKKTLSTRHSSLKNEATLNDFNSELLFALENDGNFSNYHSYFHAFTQLFDHNKWNINSFEHEVSSACLKDVQTYLNDLSLSIDSAVKVSDASGRYRGLYYFENSFWLGSKQYCEELIRDKVYNLQFFVIKLLIKLEPVTHKVRSMSLPLP